MSGPKLTLFWKPDQQLILVALETKRHGHGGIDTESIVVVNPADGHRIGKGDRGFVLAESQVR